MMTIKLAIKNKTSKFINTEMHNQLHYVATRYVSFYKDATAFINDREIYIDVSRPSASPVEEIFFIIAEINFNYGAHPIYFFQHIESSLSIKEESDIWKQYAKELLSSKKVKAEHPTLFDVDSHIPHFFREGEWYYGELSTCSRG